MYLVEKMTEHDLIKDFTQSTVTKIALNDF